MQIPLLVQMPHPVQILHLAQILHPVQMPLLVQMPHLMFPQLPPGYSPASSQINGTIFTKNRIQTFKVFWPAILRTILTVSAADCYLRSEFTTVPCQRRLYSTCWSSPRHILQTVFHFLMRSLLTASPMPVPPTSMNPETSERPQHMSIMCGQPVS